MQRKGNNLGLYPNLQRSYYAIQIAGYIVISRPRHTWGALLVISARTLSSKDNATI